MVLTFEDGMGETVVGLCCLFVGRESINIYWLQPSSHGCPLPGAAAGITSYSTCGRNEGHCSLRLRWSGVDGLAKQMDHGAVAPVQAW